jgi:hypothetical protein
VDVHRPVAEGGHYDLIFDTGQCLLPSDEIDAVAAYCPALNKCYYLPISLVAGRQGIYLRLTPVRNNQRRYIHDAAAYDVGAIAQLGERLSGTQEVAGSSPASSTPESRPVGRLFAA